MKNHCTNPRARAEMRQAHARLSRAENRTPAIPLDEKPALLAIDPGSELSAFLVLSRAGMPLSFGKVPNEELRVFLRHDDSAPVVVLEFMSPRGMPTSRQEMETLYWAGRFAEAAWPTPVERITRDDVKYHLCGRRARVNDVHVRAALIDRFGGIRGKEAAIGRKAAPGPLYGIAADAWAALGLAVTYLDRQEGTS